MIVSIALPSDEKSCFDDILTVVATVRKNGKIRLNAENLETDVLGTRLEEVFRNRVERVLFVHGDGDVAF
ncbi:MAG: hypothetical protein M3Y07_15685 [Acidobacteriota bacterium]|nr:hypothetical protein [Acidobacteriota bacterium]